MKLKFGSPMRRTNIVLDEKIVAKAQRLTGISTKKGVIDFALRELIRPHEVLRHLELEGKIEWDGDLHESRGARKFGDA